MLDDNASVDTSIWQVVAGNVGAVASSAITSQVLAGAAVSAVGYAAYAVATAPPVAASVESRIQAQVLLMQRKMLSATTLEELLGIQLDQWAEHLEDLEELKQRLDAVQLPNDAPEEAKGSLKKVTDGVADLVCKTMHLSPKIRKLCLFRKLGAKYLSQVAGKVRCRDGRLTDEMNALLELAAKKFQYPDHAIKEIMHEIASRATEVALDIDKVNRSMEKWASAVKQTVIDAIEAGAEAVGTGWQTIAGIFTVAFGLAAVMIGIAATNRAVSALGGVFLGAGVRLGYQGRCDDAERNSARIQEAHQQQQDAEHLQEAQRVLQRKLNRAAEIMDATGLELTHRTIIFHLESIGVDTDDFAEQVSQEFLVQAMLRDTSTAGKLEEYIIQNDALLQKVSNMEKLTLKVAEALLRENDESGIGDHHIHLHVDQLGLTFSHPMSSGCACTRDGAQSDGPPFGVPALHDGGAEE